MATYFFLIMIPIWFFTHILNDFDGRDFILLLVTLGYLSVCTRQYTYYKSLFKIGDTQCYIEFLFAPLKIIFSIRPCKSGQIKRSWASFTFFTISIRFLIPAMAFYTWIKAVAGKPARKSSA